MFCSSYRPFSLVNVDVMILAKVLAQRLEAVLPKIISEEITGFIKVRYLFFNIRTLLNIIYLKKPSTFPKVVTPLTPRRCFIASNVNIYFLFLRNSAFVTNFVLGFAFNINHNINHLRLAFAPGLAILPLNAVHVSAAPYPPLLFALAIEPLSVVLHASSSFAGMM